MMFNLIAIMLLSGTVLLRNTVRAYTVVNCMQRVVNNFVKFCKPILDANLRGWCSIIRKCICFMFFLVKYHICTRLI